MIDAIHHANLRLLQQAQTTMISGSVYEAMALYRRALRKDPLLVYGTPHELARAAYHYSEYFIQSKDWVNWKRLTDALINHPDFTRFPPECQSRLISIEGWRKMISSSKNDTLGGIIDNQLAALEHLSPLSPFDKTLHYLVTGMAYRHMGDEKNTFDYIALAGDQLVYFEESPYYYIVIQEQYAVSYYWFNRNDPTYFDRSILFCKNIENLAREVAGGYDFTGEAYNIGWAYAEKGDLETGLYHFQRCYVDALQSDFMHYEQAIANYGMGYVYLRLKQYDSALERLHEAIVYFAAEGFSYMFTAVCLNLVAAVYQDQGELEAALMRTHDALENINRVDVPLQKLHILTRLRDLYTLMGDAERAAMYRAEAKFLAHQLGREEE